MSLPQLINIDNFNKAPFILPVNEFNSRLNGIVIDTQEDLGLEILGNVLFEEFNSDWNGTTFDTQKWTDFVDGYTYLVSGKTVVWKGFKNLLKHFAYFEYIKYNVTYQSNIGIVKPGAENGTIVQNYTNEIKIYNKGIELYGIDWAFYFDKTYSLRTYRNRFCFDTDIEERKPTAYNFLYHRKSEFTNWEFTEKSNVNQFGI